MKSSHTAECNGLHINYTCSHNTKQEIKISAATIDDFRRLISLLIKSKLSIHTYALEEDHKVKAVLKGILLEFETEDIKIDLERQGYPVLAVHRMHHRDGTALGMLLKHHTDESNRVKATAVSPMAIRLRTDTCNRDVLGPTLDQGLTSQLGIG
ncbi:hypothetical protein EVAR_30493_1 [Eumeta japonica]|uniref:Pre-C2HC domain-containing protein n=1 Tax=Eumeta variegata TaxID=151549 RepID=A0A4C1VZI0_EUMVA|nr:hypothetical protein EVAR_30493_1 [Eumeta japonica]